MIMGTGAVLPHMECVHMVRERFGLHFYCIAVFLQQKTGGYNAPAGFGCLYRDGRSFTLSV